MFVATIASEKERQTFIVRSKAKRLQTIRCIKSRYRRASSGGTDNNLAAIVTALNTLLYIVDEFAISGVTEAA